MSQWGEIWEGFKVGSHQMSLRKPKMLDSSSCVAPIGQPSSLSNRRQGFENWFDRARPFSDKGPRDIMRRERPWRCGQNLRYGGHLFRQRLWPG